MMIRKKVATGVVVGGLPLLWASGLKIGSVVEDWLTDEEKEDAEAMVRDAKQAAEAVARQIGLFDNELGSPRADAPAPSETNGELPW